MQIHQAQPQDVGHRPDLTLLRQQQVTALQVQLLEQPLLMVAVEQWVIMLPLWVAAVLVQEPPLPVPAQQGQGKQLEQILQV
jgi:hypothetical protein